MSNPNEFLRMDSLGSKMVPSSLEPDGTLVKHDIIGSGPYDYLFTCLDSSKRLYLVSCSRMDAEQANYVISPITRTTLRKLYTNTCTMREAFDEESCCMYTITRTEKTLRRLDPTDPEEAKHLPTPGYTLEAEDDEFTEELDELTMADGNLKEVTPDLLVMGICSWYYDVYVQLALRDRFSDYTVLPVLCALKKTVALDFNILLSNAPMDVATDVGWDIDPGNHVKLLIVPTTRAQEYRDALDRLLITDAELEYAFFYLDEKNELPGMQVYDPIYSNPHVTGSTFPRDHLGARIYGWCWAVDPIRTYTIFNFRTFPKKIGRYPAAVKELLCFLRFYRYGLASQQPDLWLTHWAQNVAKRMWNDQLLNLEAPENKSYLAAVREGASCGDDEYNVQLLTSDLFGVPEEQAKAFLTALKI